jgi:Fe-S cluster assembly protein SufD
MKTFVDNGTFKEKLVRIFEEHEPFLTRHDTKHVSQVRYQAFNLMKELEFPGFKQEKWKNTDLKPTLGKEYYQYLEKPSDSIPVDQLFTCEVHNFETDQISFYNGWLAKTARFFEKLPEGLIVCSLSQAMKDHSELVDKHFAKYSNSSDSIFHALNTAFTLDGLFIYVPDNVIVDRPVQMISIINHPENLLIQNRNLVILGKNSKLTLVQCDDSTNHQASFTNSVTEVFLDENSDLVHYKLQNLNNDSTLLNSTSFHQLAGSRLTTYAISLNGGLIRNQTEVMLNGRGANADIYGLYLMDNKQHVDNRVFVDHAVPECTSSELFKGILDDEASSVFNGHILVRKDAQKTNAYQKNRNILLTDKAHANARPFLEIYADDVKCSHGATVGQLDNEALFYIRSRGICMASARLLLMYAFAAEVINKISISPLQSRIDDMVKQRLRGELSICDRCVLHCNNQEKEISFDIDLSKI